MPTRNNTVRVLLVEDHKPLARALRQGLEEEGFAVDVAEDGEEADYKARTTKYDAIILDLMLPKKDGLTLLQRVAEGRHQDARPGADRPRHPGRQGARGSTPGPTTT